MKILINLADAGLANNGGSQTLIRMALALKKLGHDVEILINQPNRFTWFDFPSDIIHFVDGPPNTWPKADAIMATACSTVKTTLDYPYLSMGNKFYWIRGFEVWAMSVEQLVAGYKSGLNLIVNSEWQRRQIFSLTGIAPYLVYSGIPVDEITACKNYSPAAEKREKDFHLGALFYTQKWTKRFDEVVRIANACFKLGYAERLLLFGNEYMPPQLNLDLGIPTTFLYAPTMEEKVGLMADCDVWIATTENDGLHIPPTESALCGCSLVAKDVVSSGMSDYALHGYTSINFLTEKEAVNAVEFYWGNPITKMAHQSRLQDILISKIGSVKTNARRMSSFLMFKAGAK